MELYAQDYFLIEGVMPLQQDSMESLFVLYQPFMGYEACSLYMTLYSIGNENESIKHIELCNLLDMSIDRLEKARVRLEQYGLLKTYLKEGKINQYIYRMKSVLKPIDFLNHYAFGLQYSERFGMQKYQLMKAKFESRYFDKSDYTDISEQLNSREILNLSVDQLKDIIKNKKKTNSMPIGFDYGRFLKGLSNIVFPKSLRTDENMQLIGQLAITYGISEERMRVLVSRSIDIEKKLFDKNALMRRVRSEKPDYALEKISGYDLPPVLFLQEKQYGVPVSNTDKKLLESLINDYGLTTQVVNRLIEYVLEENSKVFATEYVRKVAATWVMYGVKTVEDAHKVIAILSRNNKEKEMRTASIEKTTKVKKKKEEVLVASDEEVRELEELIEKLGERYEKN